MVEQSEGAQNMTVAGKTLALLGRIRRPEVEELRPAERLLLAQLCRYVASIADPPPNTKTKPGILVELNKYRRDE